MPHHSTSISQLLYRACSGESLNAAEQSMLDSWLQEAPENRQLLNRLNNSHELQLALKQWDQWEKKAGQDWELFAGKMQETAAITHTNKVYSLQRYWWRYAAAALLLIAAGLWLWNSNHDPRKLAEQTTDQPAVLPSIIPGRDGAVLTLADGKQVSLDSLKNGLVAEQSGTTVSFNNGQLAYQESKTSAINYNTITTPNGRQFHMQLPDGTHVWLNAASSITYPTAFPGNLRQVKITGEAYFEVAANKMKPFIVDVENESSVEVLGTSFNINAYVDEAFIKTTLLSGSVKVKNAASEALLKPGQQARFPQQQPQAAVNVLSADTEQELAWKNGFFNFNDEDIPAFLRQLERWYDIRVQYDGTIPGMKFKGGLDRNASLAEILKVLSKLNIKYRLEGRTLIVGEK